MKIILVVNNNNWKTLPEKIQTVKEWFAPKVVLDFEVIHTYFNDIPFSDFGQGIFGVDNAWYDKHISPYGHGYDIVLFLVNRKQWKSKKARGWRTDSDQGAVELQMGCDEHEKAERPLQSEPSYFFQLARHEILHALYMISGQYDTTHFWWDQGKIEVARDNLILPIDYSTPIFARLVAYLKNKYKKMTIIEPVKKTNREILYDVAITCLGIDASPNDAAPDELGCADTVSNIIKKVDPSFPVLTGTWTLWTFLSKSLKFEKVWIGEPGDIIISPTGTGQGIIKNGHVGFVGKDKKIMSNDSLTGKFVENFTEVSWKERYVNRGGYPIYYYRLRD